MEVIRALENTPQQRKISVFLTKMNCSNEAEKLKIRSHSEGHGRKLSLTPAMTFK